MMMDENRIIIEQLTDLIDNNRWSELRHILSEYNPVDTADLLKGMDPDKSLRAFRILPKDCSASVFAYMDSEQQANVVESISNNEVRALMDDLSLDDAVDFLEEVPASVVHRVLLNTNDDTRDLINAFMRYPENSAGSIMTIEFVEFKENWTVREAMDHIRKTAFDKETIYTCYVVNQSQNLVGIVPLRQLILARDDQTICEMMNTHVISVKTLDDQEAVADTVRKYDIMAIPVVDNENRLVGIITVDDIIDVIEEENTEDFEKMAAMTPSETEYMKTPAWRLAVNRIPWLFIMMISAMFTGMIIRAYDTLLQTIVLLAAFIPMLMDTAGNCGAQASTLIIRGMALGEVRFGDILRVIWKEFRVGLTVGIALVAVVFLRLMLLDKTGLTMALVVCVTLFCTVVLAKIIGCTLPMLAHKCKLDPALMASPMITTIVDACSLAIYFFIASHLFTRI
jgi:magnesium transporter